MNNNKKFSMPTAKKLMSQVARVKTTNKLGLYLAGACGLAIIGIFAFSGMSNAVVQDDDNALTNKLKPKLDMSISDDDIKPKSIAINTTNPSTTNIDNNMGSNTQDEKVKRVLAQEAKERAELENPNNLANSNKSRYEASSYIPINNIQANINSVQQGQSIPNIPAMPNMESLQNQMPDISSLGIGGGDANMQKRKEAFTTKSGNFGYLDSQLQPAVSEKEILAGTVIPAILTHSLNSDLPGIVNAIVSQDVYDSITHSHIVIAKGTKLNGIYDSNLSFGQEGLAVVWNRLVFSDGSTFDIGSMTGADQGGNSGFRDKVNNHYGRTFGSAILVALIGSGMQLSQPKGNSNSGNDARETITANVAQQTGNTAQGVLNKTLNVQPTVTIKAGYRFNVMVNKDFVVEN